MGLRGGRLTVDDREPEREGHAGRAACKKLSVVWRPLCGEDLPASGPGSCLSPTSPPVAPAPQAPQAPALWTRAPAAGRTKRRRRRCSSTSTRALAAASRPRHAALVERAAPPPARGPSPGVQAGGRARGELRAPLCCLWRPCTAQRAQPAPGAERRPRLLLLSLPLPSSAASPRPPPVPPSLPLSEHSMSERSEDDVGAFSNPVSLGCCCRRNREKATRRKSNGDTGSQSAQSGGVSGQTLVLLDRRRQITLLRQ